MLYVFPFIYVSFSQKTSASTTENFCCFEFNLLKIRLLTAKGNNILWESEVQQRQ